MDPNDNTPKTATVRLALDGYLVLAESSMTIADGARAVGSWYWNIPFGLGGSPHYISVQVEFR